MMIREELIKELKELILQDEHNELNSFAYVTSMDLDCMVNSVDARERRLDKMSDEELAKYYEKLKIKVENKD